tara:strand:- start:1495 stop:1680 length:186 start_codon:yes stop_codon:yes gene_type:complete
MGSGKFNIKLHPLYCKYNSFAFSAIDVSLVKSDLNKCLATEEGAQVVAYLCWLLRTKELLA